MENVDDKDDIEESK